MLKAINPAGVPANPVYSQAIEASGYERMLFISGQVGIAPDGQVPEDAAAQTRLAIANLRAVLAEAGLTADNVARYTIYLTDGAHLEGFMDAAAPELPLTPPATTLLIVAGLPDPRLKVEIEAIAVG
jgi:2-iminobutanoate/2-iminopropanoate deaminase